MKNSINQIFLLMGSIAIAMTLIGCEGESMETSNTTESSQYEIASDEYSNLSLNSLNLLASFDMDAWAELLADDVEFYFPDGDSGTRTALTGKEEVVNWWKNWAENSGIESMTITQPDQIPVRVNNEALSYSALTGVFVISYFSSELVYDNGNTVNIRMNFALHFNDDQLIDRYYAYYDRSLIIEAMNENILSPETD